VELPGGCGHKLHQPLRPLNRDRTRLESRLLLHYGVEDFRLQGILLRGCADQVGDIIGGKRRTIDNCKRRKRRKERDIGIGQICIFP